MPIPGTGRIVALVCLLVAASLPGQGLAEDFPVRPIRLIVPFPAGGPADIIARILGQKMQDSLGQAVVIENRGGAGGMTGVDAVAKAAADGYTIGLASLGTLAINPGALANMPYNVQRDLKPVSMVARVPELLVVASNVPAKTLPDFIALAKARDGGLNFASTGTGSMPHLAAALFVLKAGIKATHVPYRGAAPAVNDLLANQVQFMFADVPVLLPHVQAGTFTALGVGSSARSPSVPNVRTMVEQGLPDVVAENWYGLIAPGATPAEVLAKLNKVTIAALASPDVKNKLALQGANAESGTPEEFAALIASETKKWGDVIRQAGITLEQ